MFFNREVIKYTVAHPQGRMICNNFIKTRMIIFVFKGENL